MAKLLNSSRWMLALVFGGCLLALPVIGAQTTTAPPATVTSQVTAEQLSTAMALLDRIDRLVSAARKDTATTSRRSVRPDVPAPRVS